MKSDFVDRTVLVHLPATFIDTLLKVRATLDNDLASLLETSLASCSGSLKELDQEEATKAAPLPNGRYVAEFLGVPFATRTLPEVFAEIVDMTAEVAPEALDRLSEVSARTRRFVARRPEAVHPGNHRLPVMQTASGWWISKNIGQEDLMRALRALCRAAGLSFGADVKFSLRHRAT
ncbi:MAG: hypothetical protein EA405_11745 [Rhodospirillales bacterium]|nr:MAG: hypothetical protein EA405_11745 [Rhodospirillales bacterium]